MDPVIFWFAVNWSNLDCIVWGKLSLFLSLFRRRYCPCTLMPHSRKVLPYFISVCPLSLCWDTSLWLLSFYRKKCLFSPIVQSVSLIILNLCVWCVCGGTINLVSIALRSMGEMLLIGEWTTYLGYIPEENISLYTSGFSSLF